MYSVLRVDFSVVPGHPYRSGIFQALNRLVIIEQVSALPCQRQRQCDFALRLCCGVYLLLAVDAFANQTC